MTAPVRKVVDHRMYGTTDLVQDVLDCGHVLNDATDIYGRRSAVRRRCFYCQLEESA